MICDKWGTCYLIGKTFRFDFVVQGSSLRCDMSAFDLDLIFVTLNMVPLVCANGRLHLHFRKQCPLLPCISYYKSPQWNYSYSCFAPSTEVYCKSNEKR